MSNRETPPHTTASREDFALTRTRRGGFTLVELLVAVAILGILGVAVINEIWGSVDDAKQTTTKAKVDSIHDIVSYFKRKHNRLPEDLEELLEPDDRNNGEPWLDEDDLRDAWGRVVELRFGDRPSQYEIVSLGANGEDDNSFDVRELGLDAEVGSKHTIQIYEDE